MWESSEKEHLIFTSGIEGKCVFCEKPSDFLMHCWLDEFSIRNIYVCKEHKPRIMTSWKHGAFQRVGWKRLTGVKPDLLQLEEQEYLKNGKN